MTLRGSLFVASVLALFVLSGCSRFPGKPGPGPEVPRPDSIVDPVVLFSQNCAGCHGADGKQYAAKSPGNATHGLAVYGTYCASCHGPDGNGGEKAGSIVKHAYLALITDQGLRTIVITGRPDFNAPDWRNNVPGHPMTEQDITDVVAWLASQRPALQQPSAPVSATGGAH